MTKANEKFMDLTLVNQVIVLSIGFALVISWEAAIQPRLLALITIILLVLIYPMADRLNYKIMDYQKTHAKTHILLMEIRHFVIGKSGYENIAKDELASRVHEWIDQLEKFDEGFEEGFKLERETSGADKTDFFADVFRVAFYLSTLIGSSALIGWLVSLVF